MATKRKVVGNKRTKSSAKKRRGKTDTKTNRWRFNPATDEAGHSPIIITDGSASIEFGSREYDHEGGGHHTSAGLFLREVSANMNHPTSPVIQAGDPPGSTICHVFTDFARFTVEVTVRVGGNDKTFLIVGRKSGLFKSPTIDFDITAFREGADFPPKFPQTGIRLGNANANITRLRIFRGSELMHDCPLASRNGVEYTVSDPHS